MQVRNGASPETFTYITWRTVRWFYRGYICPFIRRYCLCDFSLHWHPYLSAYLNCPNWAFANFISHKINKHHRVCLAFSFGVQKATETETPSYIWCSQVDEHTAFHSGHAVPLQIFLSSNVLMTIIMYSKDVLNFLSRIVKYFEYHWKAQETENGRKHWPSATTWRSDCNRRWLLRTNQQTPDDFILEGQLACVSCILSPRSQGSVFRMF